MSFQWDEITTDEEPLSPGCLSCRGCGAPLAMRHILRVLGENTVVAVPASCWTIIDGAFPNHSLKKVPLFHTAFASAASTAVGLKAGLRANGYNDATVLAWAGDGGTFDIGLQALSGAADRNEDILYICYDNEAYMNTGAQRSGATPYKSWTNTTPASQPNDRPKKDIIGIMTAHGIPYTATASVAFPDDLINKVKQAKEMDGTRFIHLFSPCPPGWKMDPDQTVNVARKAVETNVFPLLEVIDGTDWTLNQIPDDPQPVDEYLNLQGRFDHLDKQDVKKVQDMVKERFDRYLEKHHRSSE